MFYLIAFIGLGCYWLHAQLKLGLFPRLLSSAAVLTCVVLFSLASRKSTDFYQRGYFSRALETLTEDFTGEKRREYDAMIENFRSDQKTGANYLMKEAERIHKKYSPSEGN